MADSLAPEVVRPLLGGRFGDPYLYEPETESTQLLLLDSALPEGAVAVAEHQTAGRGRLAPKGNGPEPRPGAPAGSAPRAAREPLRHVGCMRAQPPFRRPAQARLPAWPGGDGGRGDRHGVGNPADGHAGGRIRRGAA